MNLIRHQPTTEEACGVRLFATSIGYSPLLCRSWQVAISFVSHSNSFSEQKLGKLSQCKSVDRCTWFSCEFLYRSNCSPEKYEQLVISITPKLDSYSSREVISWSHRYHLLPHTYPSRLGVARCTKASSCSCLVRWWPRWESHSDCGETTAIKTVVADCWVHWDQPTTSV